VGAHRQRASDRYKMESKAFPVSRSATAGAAPPLRWKIRITAEIGCLFHSAQKSYCCNFLGFTHLISPFAGKKADLKTDDSKGNPSAVRQRGITQKYKATFGTNLFLWGAMFGC